MSRRITLLTDFGTRDGYVAAMKAVLARLAPGVLLDDASHDLAHGDVRGGMWALNRYWRLYPRGTVHLVVVDPGVGTERRPLALEADGRYVVAPDNGVASFVVASAGHCRIREIRHVDPPLPGDPSTTFHGRDLFAPAAGFLAAGGALDRLGPAVDDPLVLEGPHPYRERDQAVGEVVRVDRFGNLITNLPGEWAEAYGMAEIEGRSIPFVTAYGFGDPGSPLAVVNSDRLVEVAVRDGSAADVLRAGVGTPVRLVR